MDDKVWMRRALEEARAVLGSTHPNPAVGALIVHQGNLVAIGATQPAGGDHAEIQALRAFHRAGIVPDESTTLYVTLEPCSTCGRTGPCTEAIARSGIRSLRVGAIDPNPRHAGRGLELLREVGLEVRAGILEEECAALNIIFNHWITTGRPLMAGKVAMTLDGRVATRDGLSKWITGPESREDVHFWRRAFPAIAVGAGTILTDNPALTVRCLGQPETCRRRFIFDRSLISFRNELPRVYSDAWREQTIVITRLRHEEEVARLESKHGIRFWLFEDPMTVAGLSAFCHRCVGEGIIGVYIEGGAQLLSSFLTARALDYLFAYQSNKLLADESGLSPFSGFAPQGMDRTLYLETPRHAIFGTDQLMCGHVRYPEENAV
jgi:diaminohydroxyphosphoribosylaminopyrimidine deaminase/5-amino-6-(5-phosphoribosylamino)uracil reductase